MGQPARIRAALAYSGRKQPDIARLLNVSNTQLSRWASGASEGRAPNETDLADLARVCEVPLWFLRNGYQEPDTEPTLERRLRVMEQRILDLEQTIAEVRREPPGEDEPGAGLPQAPRGPELPPHDPTRQPSRPARRRRETG